MRISAGLATLLLIAAVPAARAASLDAAISYTRYSADFDFTNAPTEKADIDELGLTIDESITPLFDLALQGGYSHVSFDNHPADGGYDLTGRFFGIVARSEPTLIPGVLSLRLQAAYRWHNVDNGRVDHQYDEMTWRETALQLGPVLSMGPLQVSAGGYLEHYDGREKARGPLAFQRDFSAGSVGGGYAQVAFAVSDGHVGVYARTGAQQGYGIIFSTGF
ncbi:MAG TPA: hypothetical protein VFK24_08615 [Gammaproteobacteria bacterium]|nr:hypothetical protein [Gammaproteobacteria bacterium]